MFDGRPDVIGGQLDLVAGRAGTRHITTVGAAVAFVT
jgi:hypothetical protein